MRPVGKGALRKVAATSSEAKQKLGKDAAHEIMYRIMPVSRSSCSNATERLIGLIATGNYPNLKLAKFDGKDCFCRSPMYFLAIGSGHSFDLIPFFRTRPSDGANVG